MDHLRSKHLLGDALAWWLWNLRRCVNEGRAGSLIGGCVEIDHVSLWVRSRVVVGACKQGSVGACKQGSRSSRAFRGFELSRLASRLWVRAHRDLGVHVRGSRSSRAFRVVALVALGVSFVRTIWCFVRTIWCWRLNWRLVIPHHRCAGVWSFRTSLVARASGRTALSWVLIDR